MSVTRTQAKAEERRRRVAAITEIITDWEADRGDLPVPPPTPAQLIDVWVERYVARQDGEAR